MARILNAMINHLRSEFDDEISADDDGAVTFRYSNDDDREWGCMTVADDDVQQLAFYSVWLDNVSEERRGAVMEFLTRANYGLPVGNFELDVIDGEVRLKTSVDVEDIEVSAALCRGLVDTNLAVMERYLEGLESVASGKSEPAVAIEAIEADD